LDGALRVQRANTAFFERFRVRPEDTLQQVIFRVGKGQWDRTELRSHLGAMIAGETGFRGLELETDIPGAGRRVLLVHGQKIAWQDVRMDTTILLAIDDVTELRREVEQARLLASEQSARAEAEAANRTKDEFVAMLAHELRNPLAPLRNAL